MSYPDGLITEAVTIAAGASLSGASSKHAGYSLVGIVTASTWDAAKISLAGSMDGTNFYPVRTNTAEYEIASVTGAACVAIDPAVTHMWRYFKARSGTSAAATNQVDATIVTLVYRAL
jgi:hypothetical protein